MVQEVETDQVNLPRELKKLTYVEYAYLREHPMDMAGFAKLLDINISRAAVVLGSLIMAKVIKPVTVEGQGTHFEVLPLQRNSHLQEVQIVNAQVRAFYAPLLNTTIGILLNAKKEVDISTLQDIAHARLENVGPEAQQMNRNVKHAKAVIAALSLYNEGGELNSLYKKA